jgi:tetratricopeptide (TPR) repeat protein
VRQPLADAPAPAEVSQAQPHLEEGIVAYQQGRFRAAIEHFKEADRLAPSARLSFNIALAYERMDDGPNALAYYRDYLRRSPKAENSTETSVRIAELELALQRSGVQQLSVLSAPPGAAVQVDNVSRGITPWTGELPPGSHQLVVRMNGYRELSQEFELPARHAIDIALSLTLLPSAAPRPTRAPVAQPLPADAWTVENPKPNWWTWALFGGSAALLIGSGAMELSRKGYEDDAAASAYNLDSQHAWDSMQSRKILARVLLGMGVVAGGVGGVSLYLDLNESKRSQPAVSIACAPGECGAFARGHW